MAVTFTSPATSYAEDRFVVIADPRPGTIVELAPGSQLALRFRRGIGPSRWFVTGVPGHLLVLDDSGHAFQFLVFDSADAPLPLRLERRHPDHEIAHEVCELLVVPSNDLVSSQVNGRAGRRLSGAGARTARSASPRTA